MTEPTDDEILEAVKHLGAAMLSPVEVARAVLAKWGQPAGAREPVAWRYRMKGDLQWQYTERQEQFAHADEVQPLTTPQPTQAQAGAVPLTDETDCGGESCDCRSYCKKKGGQHGADT